MVTRTYTKEQKRNAILSLARIGARIMVKQATASRDGEEPDELLEADARGLMDALEILKMLPESAEIKTLTTTNYVDRATAFLVEDIDEHARWSAAKKMAHFLSNDTAMRIEKTENHNGLIRYRATLRILAETTENGEATDRGLEGAPARA